MTNDEKRKKKVPRIVNENRKINISKPSILNIKVKKKDIDNYKVLQVRKLEAYHASSSSAIIPPGFCKEIR